MATVVFGGLCSLAAIDRGKVRQQNLSFGYPVMLMWSGVDLNFPTVTIDGPRLSVSNRNPLAAS